MKKVRTTNIYDKTPKEKRKRAARGRARYAMAKKVGSGNVQAGLSKLKGKDVDHRNGNPLDNNPSNLSVKSISKNRSFPRNRNAGKLYKNS